MTDTSRIFVERLETMVLAMEDLDDSEFWQSMLFRPAPPVEAAKETEGEDEMIERLDKLKFWILGALFSVSMAAVGYSVSTMADADRRIEGQHSKDTGIINSRFDALFERVIHEAQLNAATRADIAWIKEQLSKALANR